ncbi:hypothetical protein PORY_000972 [Pneumocystis oryctolagi]|uniref:Uncharacterized protein n=1 Tax=Pneumocystis oryctolagi TaxID=42067 RepID=A0ACB7CCD7_9ASCO|nr:hypothetical protein PORY_000972 [Pneumocystis oryctolagi]
MEGKQYCNMTVQELRSVCRTLGLPVRGKKVELIKRIEDKNVKNINKENPKLTQLEINSLNTLKEQSDKSDNCKIIDADSKLKEIISEAKSPLKNNSGISNTYLKENKSNVVSEKPKKKLQNGTPESPIKILGTNKIKKECSPHVKSNASRKLKKVVIKFVKEPVPISSPVKPLVTHQVTDTSLDSDILALGIGKSPPLAFRNKINIYSRLFARFAFCLPSSERYAFLCVLALVCKLWNFSVKFAWHQLILLEFPGKRTEAWISSIDPTIHSLRPWYIHRQKEKQRTLKLFKASWIERLFRVYGQTFSCNYPTLQKELWFHGISYNLLSDPDQKGQWEVCVRFWMSRFVLRIMSGEPWKSWLTFFNQTQNDIIVAAKKIGNSDIWRIESLNNKVWYVSGQSGEAIGWDFSSYSYDIIDTKNITWKNLRFDWKSYISKIINSDSSYDLFDCVFYHGDSYMYPRGIHKNIKDHLRHSLAKRFVLSHVVEYGVSGLYESRPFSFGLNSNLILDLEQKYSVENVRLSGETAIYNQVLCPGLSYIQTMEVGMFVLDEIGLEVGDDVCGVRDIWALLLGCDTWGKALDDAVAEKTLVCTMLCLTSIFHILVFLINNENIAFYKPKRSLVFTHIKTMLWKQIQSIPSSISSLTYDFDNEQELDNMYDYLIKLVIIGPSGTGKTSMLHRFVKNEFRSLSSHTIGVEFSSKVVKLGVGAHKKRIKLQLWDTAGQERFRSVSRSYYRAAAGALLVYDITNHDSFTSLPSWLEDARALASPDLVVVLIGNKCDCGKERDVTVNEAMCYANREGLSLLEVSALTSHLIDDAFLLVARQILSKIELGQIDPNLPQFGVQYGSVGICDRSTFNSIRDVFMRRRGPARWLDWFHDASGREDNVSVESEWRKSRCLC